MRKVKPTEDYIKGRLYWSPYNRCNFITDDFGNAIRLLQNEFEQIFIYIACNPVT